jgi:hypothetical protein
VGGDLVTDDLAVAAITEYLDRKAEAARVAAEKAAAEHHRAYEISAAWDDRRQWTPHRAGDIDLAAYSLVGAMDGAALDAMRGAIEHRTDANLAAVDEAKARAAAVRDWLRARGINWGEPEERAPKKRR